MFRRTILPITSSEIIKTGLKGRIEAQTVNEEVNIFLEGQIDSGFISEITIGGNVYKGFLVKMDANPAPPPANRDPTTSSMIIPNMQPPKGIPGFDNLMYPSPLMSSAAFHPAPSFVPPPHPQTIALPPIDDESEKRDKKRKKEKRREKRDNSSSEEEKKDKKKKKKKKDTDNKRPDKSSSSKSSKPANKPPSKPSVPQAPNYPSAPSQLSFPPWFDVSQLSGNPGNSAAPLGWSGQSFATSLSTKCNSCQQILLYPSGEKTVRCPSCKAILDVENAESSVLRPCMGCGTMLGNPTNAIKVLCPLCKTTMDWSQAGKVTVQRENSGTKAVINLDEEESKPAPTKTEESPKEEEKKENGKEETKEDVMKVESTTTTSSPTTPPEEKSS